MTTVLMTVSRPRIDVLEPAMVKAVAVAPATNPHRQLWISPVWKPRAGIKLVPPFPGMAVMRVSRAGVMVMGANIP